ncbi:glycosyltransferase family 39 protein [Phytohabitans sp. ZYX-F-186]|uniref:Glycosyltransferase family 39 protein n=1 Tax=Phytohabitans maris TaxID=3071409 RepID=A0ABU0ZRH7_9ACTN|nr:glycosyltransferase family 39 protein [Phytohabitans sp. ZYX-F-186]MDQ7909612.1 glycosyltransferase family 39 protein [Phytohabitans sp. ZYX-F-186]
MSRAARSQLPVATPNGEVHIPLPRRVGEVLVPETAAADATILLPKSPTEEEAERKQRRAAWQRRIAWGAPALAAFALCVIGLTGPGLWADELATWGNTTVSWAELWRQLDGTDATIGPYYVLIRAWTTVFGDSDLALRLPSTLAMAAAAAVVGLIGNRLGSPRIGLLGGLAFAILPITTRYGQEARPYAFAVLAAAVATLLLLRLMEGFTLGIALAYAAAVMALGAMHIVSLLILAAHGLAVAIHRRKLLWRWTPSALAGLVPLIPIILIGRRQQGTQISWIPLTDLHQIEAFGTDFFGGALIGGAVIALGAAAVSRERGAVMAASLAAVPVALLMLLGSVTHIWLQRYVLYTIVGWAVLIGLLLAKRGLIAAVATLAALAALSLPGQVAVREPSFRYQDTKAVVALIERDYQPGDGIVYGLTDRGPGALNRDVIAHYLPENRRPTDLLVDRPMRTDGWMVASEHQDVASRLGATRRVWVLRLGEYGDPLDDLDGGKKDVLKERYDVADSWWTTGYTVALLTRKDPV